jgi:hypothetical protein
MTLIGGAVLGGVGGFPLGAIAQPSSGALDGVLRKAVQDKAVVGVVAMAANRNGAIYQGAFGVADAASGRALAPDALFRIASMTKAITSTAAMQLIEQGRVGLDDPVEKYLPAFSRLQVFESFDPATGAYRLAPARSIATVRHLMTHTSGLGYPFTSATLRDFKPRPGEDYPIGPLLFEPGARWHYGTSTDWLGKVVEAVSGRPLDEYFRHGGHVLQRAREQAAAPGRRASPRPGRHHRQGRGAAAPHHQPDHRRWRARLDSSRLHPLRADDPQRRRARRRTHPQGRHRRGDGPKRDRQSRRSRAEIGAAGA